MSDLISRKALFEEIKSLTVTVMGLRAGKGVLHEYAKQYRDTLLRIINEQPTIEAVPVVHGEWIKNRPNIGVMEKFHRMGIGKEMSVNSIYWTCSHCGNWGTPNHKFCSNCGADMQRGGAK